jgi:hypothetical protein
MTQRIAIASRDGKNIDFCFAGISIKLGGVLLWQAHNWDSIL